ncbi:BrnT family toxin (plasmid) [Cereibacter azotoformans]|uniref:BrnT family toxin n=1 Tax=Cereibacter azotoformans TaxID=43057 RepID=UPI003B20DD64
MSDGLEWDEDKRARTLAERGLDFADVALLDWDAALTAEDRRETYAEPRFVTVGPIRGRLCVMAWCWRGTNMRIISLRKANAREEKRHEEGLHRR